MLQQNPAKALAPQLGWDLDLQTQNILLPLSPIMEKKFSEHTALGVGPGQP